MDRRRAMEIHRNEARARWLLEHLGSFVLGVVFVMCLSLVAGVGQ